MNGKPSLKISVDRRTRSGWRSYLPVSVERLNGRWSVHVFPFRLTIWTVSLFALSYFSAGTLLFLNDLYRKDLEDISWWDRMYPPNWQAYSISRGNAMIKRATESVEEGDLSGAIHQLRSGLFRSPHHVPGRLLLADLYLYAQRQDLAKSVLINGLDYLSDNASSDLLIERTISFLSENQEDATVIARSEAILANASISEGSQRFLALALAHAYFFRGNFDQAEDCLRMFNLRLTFEGRMLSARIEWDRGFHALALVLIDQLAKENPADDNIYRLRVKWLLEDQQIDRARHLSLLRRVTFPDLVQPRLDLLYALDRANDKQAVLEEADLFIRAFPDQLKPLLMLGDFAANTGNTETAQRVFEQALAHELPLEGLALMRVESRIVAGKYREAIEDARTLLAARPDWEEQMAPIFNGLQSIAHYALGDRESADLYLNDFLEQRQVRADNLVAVSKRLVKVGAINQAHRVLVRAVEQDPLNQLALTTLVEFELSAPESASLAEHLSRLLTMRRPSPALLNEAYEKLGRDRFIFLPQRETLLDRVTSVLAGKPSDVM